MNLSRPGGLLLQAAAFTVVFTGSVAAQTPASLPASGTYSQNFDLLRQNNATPASTTMTAVTNAINSSPFTAAAAPNALDGWIWRIGSGTRNTSFRRSDGTDSTNSGLGGGGYSYGNNFNDGEAALGVLTTGNVGSYFGLAIRNNTGAAQTSVTVSYTGEQWRFGGRTDNSADRLDVRFALGQSSLPGPAAGVAVPELAFSSVVTGGAAGPLDGNNAAYRTTITHTINFAAGPWQDGQDLALAWYDQDAVGLDDGLAIDDLQIFVTPVPEPAGMLAAGGLAVAAWRVRRRAG